MLTRSASSRQVRLAARNARQEGARRRQEGAPYHVADDEGPTSVSWVPSLPNYNFSARREARYLPYEVIDLTQPDVIDLTFSSDEETQSDVPASPEFSSDEDESVFNPPSPEFSTTDEDEEYIFNPPASPAVVFPVAY
jgi:hypothetical protein